MRAAEAIHATPTTAARTMHAIAHRTYGTPEVLAFEELARPVPGDDEVLVRVHAAAVSIGDHHIVAGLPYVVRLSPFCGVSGPKHLVPGAALAGRVEGVGARVTSLRLGDEVFGDAGNGAFAEYAAVPAAKLVAKPKNLSFEEAAATPWAIASLQALRDAAALKAGQRVLINGASGGVGTWAVQIAKAMGAEVTAVASTRNVEMLRALGADEVVDYTKEDFTAGGARFHVVLDTVGNRSIADLRRVLLAEGTLVSCSGGNSSLRWLSRMAWMGLSQPFTRQRLKPFIAAPCAEDLLALKALVEEGRAKPVIERTYPLSEVGAALQHVGGGHTRGQVVIRIPA